MSYVLGNLTKDKIFVTKNEYNAEVTEEEFNNIRLLTTLMDEIEVTYNNKTPEEKVKADEFLIESVKTIEHIIYSKKDSSYTVDYYNNVDNPVITSTIGNINVYYVKNNIAIYLNITNYLKEDNTRFNSINNKYDFFDVDNTDNNPFNIVFVFSNPTILKDTKMNSIIETILKDNHILDVEWEHNIKIVLYFKWNEEKSSYDISLNKLMVLNQIWEKTQ